jgi:hypothetical protein
VYADIPRAVLAARLEPIANTGLRACVLANLAGFQQRWNHGGHADSGREEPPFRMFMRREARRRSRSASLPSRTTVNMHAHPKADVGAARARQSLMNWLGAPACENVRNGEVLYRANLGAPACSRPPICGSHGLKAAMVCGACGPT